MKLGGGIPAFYPMRVPCPRASVRGVKKRGDKDMPSWGSHLTKAVPSEAGANPASGVRATAIVNGNSGESPVRSVQPQPAWGALGLETGGAGSLIRSGDRPKQPTVKSSTTRGPRGLAG